MRCTVVVTTNNMKNKHIFLRLSITIENKRYVQFKKRKSQNIGKPNFLPAIQNFHTRIVLRDRKSWKKYFIAMKRQICGFTFQKIYTSARTQNRQRKRKAGKLQNKI